MDGSLALFILAYVLMGIGLIGAVVPLIPGPPLIWVGAFLWALADGFHRVGWLPLILMAVIALVALASDLLATLITGKKAGMSWRTTGAAILGGLAGGIFFSVLPVLGTLAGAILGALLGVVLAEYQQTRDWPRAWHAARVYALAFLVGRLFELVLCLLMLAVFIWNVFF